MTQEEKIKYWIDISTNDLKAAEIMLNNYQYLYAGFMCQQVVEKIIKGYFTKVKDNPPPHIHDLTKLAKQSGLNDLLSEEQKMFLKEVNPFNIEARYPEYKSKIAEYLTDETTASVFNRTKEFFEWTKEKILFQ